MCTCCALPMPESLNERVLQAQEMGGRVIFNERGLCCGSQDSLGKDWWVSKDYAGHNFRIGVATTTAQQSLTLLQPYRKGPMSPGRGNFPFFPPCLNGSVLEALIRTWMKVGILRLSTHTSLKFVLVFQPQLLQDLWRDWEPASYPT